MVKEIPLTRGKVALVDDEDYERVMQYKWCTHKDRNTWYATRTSYNPKKSIPLHRFIMNAKPGEEVDHINHNGLDDRRCNLRIVTRSQNHMNRGKMKNKCTSKYKGVYWFKNLNKWMVHIEINGKKMHVGLFNNEEEAARAYDKKAKELFGEYAYFNFIDKII